MQKKAFAVVGHSNWGKSRTLKALTDGTHQFRWWEINYRCFLIKRMSNDDDSDALLDYVKGLTTDDDSLIFALCPNFDDDKRRTVPILNELARQGYQLYFWVIEKAYNRDQKIVPAQLNALREYGKVQIESKKLEASSRAKELLTFIKAHI